MKNRTATTTKLTPNSQKK